MQITINSDCSEITLTSDILLLTNTANSLFVTYNGVEKEVALPLSITTFTLEPADIDQTDVFSDGVYKLRFENTLSSGAVKEDVGCAVPLCTFKCSDAHTALYTEVLNGTKDAIDKLLYYEGLKATDGCTSCTCELLSTLYTNLTDDDTNSCGTCSCSV